MLTASPNGFPITVPTIALGSVLRYEVSLYVEPVLLLRALTPFLSPTILRETDLLLRVLNQS
jgi:hypothetical protein